MKPLRIGTRGSPLALWQAQAVGRAIEQAGGPACEPVVIRTTGDRLATRPLATVGGKRLFVKEIEDALLRGAVDLAAHSAKDLPADLPPGLAIGATLPREDPRDVLVASVRGAAAAGGGAARLVAACGPAPRVGTGSVRRIAQLSRAFPGASFEPIRGNVETRLRKLDAGEYDLLVLAAAGLLRLGLANRISAPLEAADCMPAPGQGIVAVELRAEDEATAALLAPAGDRGTRAAFDAERALVRGLGADCRTPLGAIATADAGGLTGDLTGSLTLEAVVASLDGAQRLQGRVQGPAAAAAALGERLAGRLLADGADRILDGHRG